MQDISNFYREYARGGIHAASAAAMTAFGLLTIYHEAFAVLALLSYVVPALYMYAEWGSEDGQKTENGDDRSTETGRSDPSAAGRPAEKPEERVDGDGTGGGESRGGDGIVGTHERDERSDHLTEDERSEPRSTPEGDVGSVGSVGDESGVNDEEWVDVDSPVGVDFSDVVDAEDGVYAVGEDGYVLARANGEWSAVLEDGPAAQGENLTGVDATDDGHAVWVAGDGGALGRVDAASTRHTDHSAPDGDTSTLSDIAVVGEAGAEVVVLVNGSGEVRRGEYDGERVRWEAAEKPGSGSSFSAVAFVDDGRGYLADTNGSVFRTTDGGETYEELGIDDAGTLTAVEPVSDRASNTESFVTEDDGTVHRYDGARWTPVRPTDEGLWAMVVEGDSDRVVAVGEHGTALDGNDGDWQRRETPTDETLRGVCAATDRQVAVGDDGAILERRRARLTTERPR